MFILLVPFMRISGSSNILTATLIIMAFIIHSIFIEYL